MISGAARLRLRPGLRLSEQSSGDGSVAIVGAGETELPGGRQVEGGSEGASDPLTIHGPGPGARAALERLAAAGGSRQELLAVAVDAGGHAAAAELFGLLGELAQAELLCLLAEEQGRPLALAIPATAEALLRVREGEPPAAGRLSRHCCLRREGAALVLEAATDDLGVELLDVEAVVVLHHLARAWSPAAGSRAAARVYELLWRAGMVEPEHEVEALRDGASSRDSTSSDSGVAVESWEWHDLVFHARSRSLGRRRPYGGTYLRSAEQETLPAVREQPSGPKVALARPDISLGRPDFAAVEAGEPSFTAVLESRRSERRFGDPPIDAAQLGELLFRAARVRRRFASEHDEVSSRPYPGGGALYELEIYPVVDRCTGLDTGLYHYCPLRHELTQLAGRTRPVEALLDSAARTAGSGRPQVLLVLAARFGRVFRKYSAIGYATILKDVGVLDQTLSLVAAAMGLAACALGGGSGRRFAEATGNDPLVEGSVGELIVGSRPDSGAASGSEAGPVR